MKYYIIFISVLLIILITGCDETRPGVINGLIFNDDTEWVDRDRDDPGEWVAGECCNDYIPFPLGLDTTLTARIEPADDLDWFELGTGPTTDGALFLSSDMESITLRVFDGQQQEYDLLLDTLATYGRMSIYKPVYWTPLAGGDTTTYYALVQSEDELDTGPYTLIWSQQQRDTQLSISRPTAGDILVTGSFYVIQWANPTASRVSLALLKDGVMVSNIEKNLAGTVRDYQYLVDPGLEPDTTYQIMLYQSDDPQIMDISNVFEIR